jgi:uncharacterized membrane protein YvlD (DUF360 family)
MSFLRRVWTTWLASFEVAKARIKRLGVRGVLVAWILQAVVLFVVGNLIPGILISDPFAALFAVVVIALLNTLVRPILILLTLPLTVISFGIVSLLINAAILVIAAPLTPGLEVSGFLPAFAAAVAITAVTTFVNVLLSVDEDDTFYAELARRIARLETPVIPGGRGLVIIQIDGLAAPVLRNAIRVGLTPRMAAWVRSGRYRLVEWECAPPSQTSASQAGILHGDNDDIPAFRWYERDRGRLMVSNHPSDAAEIEARVSDGRGLLSAGGTSVGNLFSGDARRNLFTMSRLTGPTRVVDVDAFSLYFVDPAAMVRTVARTIAEIGKELLEARRQRALDIRPRIHRGGAFPFLRAITNVLLRDLNVSFLMQAMYRGEPTMYVDFVDYDEIAHHAGPERLESLRSLTGVDQILASLERAAAGAPREYAFVVLSDHGQSQGATFLQRYERSLETVIGDLMGDHPTTVAATGAVEPWGPVNALLTELIQRPGVGSRVVSQAVKGRTREGAVELGGPKTAEVKVQGVAVTGPEGPADLVVCASGNLANVYLTAFPERATLEGLEARYPGLVARLAAHPGVGFVLVRTEDRGTLVVGSAGIRHLSDDRVDGADPLTVFGPRTADHLRRLDSFRHTGDLLVNSLYDPDLEEVAAFEELVGSHGGLGGPQTRPFLLYPAELELSEPEIVGAPAIYRQLRAWGERLGVPAGAEAAALPAVSIPPSEPRALWLIALLFAISSLGWLAAAGLVLVNRISGIPTAGAAVVALVLGAVGVVGLATAIGIQRRWRWAWAFALVVQGLGVLQLLVALATPGMSDLGIFGLLEGLIALATFYYLTRPHVAAAFGRPARRPAGESPGAAPSG